MAELNFNHGKSFSTAFTYTGYVLMIAAIITVDISLTSLFLFIPGLFIAFTYDGTIIDTDNKRVKPYTALFGIFKTGKWIELKHFTRFNILKVTGRSSMYSRGNVRLDMNVSDVRLQLINHDGSRKVVINKFKDFEEAQKLKDELNKVIFPEQSE
jgi:hypothetical protein